MVRASIRVCASLLLACSYLPLFAQQAADTQKPVSTGAGTLNIGRVPPPANPPVTGLGTVGNIPMWDTTSDIINSVMVQKSSSIGIGTTTPAATLDVNGRGDFRDTLTLFPKSTDNTLAVSGTTFRIDSTGKVTFIAGQTFPGTGTITGVTTAGGSGLTGGGTSGTLSLKVAPLGVTNAMLQNSKITLNGNSAGGLTTPGVMTLGGTSTIGLKPCAANQILQFSGTVWNCSSAGTGTITGVTTAAGSGLAGGGTTGTLSLKVAALGVTNAMLQNSKVTLNANSAGGLTTPGVMTLGGTSTIGLKPCAANQILQFSGTVWNCSSAGTGTITGVTTAAGSGLSGGGTSGTLSLKIPAAGVTNAMLQNSSLTVTAGSGLSGGGLVALGGSVTLKNTGVLTVGNGTGLTNTGGQNPTLAIDTSVVPTLAGVNFFSGFSDFDGNEPGWEVEVSNSGAGDAILASNTSVDSSHPTLSLTNFDSTSPTDLALDVTGPSFGGECSIDVTGNLFCTGTLGAAVRAGAKRKVGVYGMQSPENWIEDFGAGTLTGGVITVNLEPSFAKTISGKGDYHVFVTPAGDCEGLYVTNRTATSFEVRELKGGTSNVNFDYRIVAHRRGLEAARLPELNLGNVKPTPQQDGHVAGSN